MQKRARVWQLLILISFSVLFLGLVAACSSDGPSEGATSQNVAGENEAETDTRDDEGNKPAPGTVMGIGVQGQGGNFNAAGTVLAQFFSDHTDYRVSVRPFQGMSAWGPLVDAGELEMGFTNLPELTWGYRGESGFSEMKNLRLLIRGNNLDNVPLMVRVDSGIEKVADLKGKRVASEYPGSQGAPKMITIALEVNGLSWEDVQPIPVTTNPDALVALRDGNVDAIFGMTPYVPDVVDAHQTIPLRGLSLIDDLEAAEGVEPPKEVLEIAHKYMPGLQLNIYPPDPNGILPGNIWTLRYQTALGVSAHVDNQIVYDMLEALWEHYEELEPLHAWMKEFTPEQMFDPNPPVPYHDGAVQFFKDKGLWNDEVEKIQQSLLN